MDETNSTPAETTENQTPPEAETNSQPENQTPENAVQEPEKTEVETAENVEEGKEAEPKEPKEINWEQRAKENQASFTRVSQEKAELVKKVAELENQLKPKIVENGRINPEFEAKYTRQVDLEEYYAFDTLARQLDPEQRAEVEKLLLEADRLYNPSNKSAYNAKLNQVKDYFRSDIVEDIALKKQKLQGQMKQTFEAEIAKEKQQRANNIASQIEAVPELKNLVSPDSPNYTEEVFNIVKTMFDLTGNVDIQATTKAIEKIKEIGVKEHLAKIEADKTKEKATVPSGETVLQKQTSTLPTADEIRNTPGLYTKLVKQFEGDQSKVDAILMKG